MLVPTYRRLPSTLHSARAGVASLYCVAFSFVAALFPHPLVLAAVACAVIAAGVYAGVGRELVTRSLRLALPFALLVVTINGLVSQRGATVVFRGGTILGHRFDVTAESLAWGGITALQICCVFLAFGLFAAVVDPDELLRLMRRVSYRSALTGSLATRLVPVVARDAARMGDAARCRPTPPGRLEVTRAALTGALERSVEVAAALEVRGYATARPPRRAPRPWSRHDWRVLAGTLLAAGAAIAASAGGAAWIVHDPTFRMALGVPELALVAAVLAAGVLPFAGSRARLGVVRG
ncbi:MAG: energy-coupling factor transport system permease protein [Thermoleophilaceae bacterium]|jgi:energy-coupling factor transport system permease protein|nr:energy-coupling factor transport system permease protein [Thermoleophilaceae bacterium]